MKASLRGLVWIGLGVVALGLELALDWQLRIRGTRVPFALFLVAGGLFLLWWDSRKKKDPPPPDPGPPPPPPAA